MAEKSVHGLWIVRNGEPQWLAWREWLRAEMGRRFWPDTATVPMEWPPQTPQAASAVADHFREAREAAAKDKDARGIAFDAVPVAPRPWIRWTPEQSANRLSARMAETYSPELPSRDMGYVERLLKRAGLVPWYRQKYKPADAHAPRREPTEAEKAELASRESALASERKRALESRLPVHPERE